MAAYGTGPRLQQRLTEEAPTESAIRGMLCAALGIRRGEPAPALDGLQVEVVESRHDGILEDFHTIRDAVTYDGAPGRNAITTRHYLSDFSSTVTLRGDLQQIRAIAKALARPKFQLYLGRRSCVPSGPIWAVAREEA
jgi:CRISPR system Cascade subunit CasD